MLFDHLLQVLTECLLNFDVFQLYEDRTASHLGCLGFGTVGRVVIFRSGSGFVLRRHELIAFAIFGAEVVTHYLIFYEFGLFVELENEFN